MGHTRERYNAKARQSSTKPHKRAKFTAGGDEHAEDPNAAILPMKSEEEKILQRKNKMIQEVCLFPINYPALNLILSKLLEQSESKFTSKRKKRLEKYIGSLQQLSNFVCTKILSPFLQDKKLKKEERVQVMGKLQCVFLYFSICLLDLLRFTQTISSRFSNVSASSIIRNSRIRQSLH